MATDLQTVIKRPLYVFDLPPELLASLQLKTSSASAYPQGDSRETTNEVPRSPSPSQNGTSQKTISCALCSLTFANVQEQRNHARSDLHRYNLKQKLKGLAPVSEVDFERLIGELDESISGSESSGSDSDSGREGHTNRNKDVTNLSSLLKRQAKIADSEDETFTSKKKQRGAGKPPLFWFTNPSLPQNTSIGIYRALFTNTEQEEEQQIVESLRKKQLSTPNYSKPPEDGGVQLPSTRSSPHIFLCMIGGGHFAAMIVSLAPKVSNKQGAEERQATVLAHKTFHRYTTRRKQGGSQSTNDAKGAAQSAGASLRRYNEAALSNEVRELLTEWKSMIDTSELLFIRATGSTNRRTLFGPYEGQVLNQKDPRNRGFPFSTRRATQAELMRCFVELTRAKVSQVDEAAVAAAAAAAEEKEKATKTSAQAKPAAPKPVLDPEEEAALLHTSQIESLTRRSKAPALLSYLTSNSLSPDFRLHPPEAHHHAPTPLHLAASLNSPALVTALLTKAGADPTIRNEQGRTAFELAGERSTRDAFRLARSELSETRWDWAATGVPEGLGKADIQQRDAKEAEEEKARREDDLAKLREVERRKEEERRAKADGRREQVMGKGKTLGQAAKEKTAEERREEEGRGMSEEMRRRMERERRARAALARMQGSGGGS